MKPKMYALACILMLAFAMTMNTAHAFSVNVVVTNVTCFGGNNGAATAFPAPPGTYTYQWSNGATTAGVTGLLAGTYSVTVTKLPSGQTVVKTVVINQPAMIKFKLKGTNSCSNCAGTATVSGVGGGVPPYAIMWSNAAITATIAGLCTGTYTVTITDANGCTASGSITIVSTPLTVTAVASTACNTASCNGTVTTTVTGVPPYAYLWSNAATTSSLMGMCPGTYAVTVTSALGCTATATVTIPVSAPVTASTVGTNVTCFGMCNGTAVVTPGGGTLPYAYQWSNGATTAAVTVLCPGTYVVTVTDANGCSALSNVTITQPTQLVVSVTFINATSGCNGQATANVIGGTPGYTYQWSNTAITPTVTNLCPGAYGVTVTDANGCTAAATVVIVGTALSATVAVSNVTCFGACNGIATAAPTGGTPPYTYLWSNTAVTPTITGLCPGTYSVTVTDANLNTTSITITVVQPTPLIVNINPPTPSCPSATGGCNGVASAIVSGGTPFYSYLWSNLATTPFITGLCPGTYAVTVTDSKGCTASATTTIIVFPAVLITAASTPSCFTFCSGTVTTSVIGTPPFVYSWTNGAVTQNLSGVCAGTYGVTVVDANGCSASAFVSVGLLSCRVGDDVPTEATGVQVYPNPFQDETRIAFLPTSGGYITLDVYSATGMRVMQAYSGVVKAHEAQMITLQTGTLAQGVYLYRLTTSDGVYTGQLIHLER